ncbi:MAG: agmatinase family protein [Syntrophales bacterium]
MTSEKTKAELRNLALGQPAAQDGGIFGAMINPKDAALVLIPAPFDLTTSYGKGTMDGPLAISAASVQLDLFDVRWGGVYKAGIALLDEDPQIRRLSIRNAPAAKKVIKALETGRRMDVDRKALARVNEATHAVTQLIEKCASHWIDKGKRVGLVGGDHSCPLGLLKALARRSGKEGFGILHIDAHHDLREAYEGFIYSHASIMYNVLHDIPEVTRLVSVAIRDFSQAEHSLAATHPKIATFYNDEIFRALADGRSFKSVVDRIIEALPQNVYVSFDIDGLEPANCPFTGTPVPGGLTYQQGVYLIEQLCESGRSIVGFDLCEVASEKHGEWDGNVGARLLYKLCGALIRSQKLPDLV